MGPPSSYSVSTIAGPAHPEATLSPFLAPSVESQSLALVDDEPLPVPTRGELDGQPETLLVSRVTREGGGGPLPLHLLEGLARGLSPRTNASALEANPELLSVTLLAISKGLAAVA